MRRAVLLAGLFAAACGGNSAGTLTATGLGLPSTAHVTPQAAATLKTSPDGGIYENPDPLSVLLVSRLPMHPVADHLGTLSQWSGLEALGDLTVIGFRLGNEGKAGSDPQLNDLQVASDLAPPGTAGGPLRHFYHPSFPLAALSDVAVSGDCSIHLDPGQTATVVLVYPPIRPVALVTWGRYGDFALKLRAGGALPSSTAGLHASACVPPAAQPT